LKVIAIPIAAGKLHDKAEEEALHRKLIGKQSNIPDMSLLEIAHLDFFRISSAGAPEA